MYFHIFSDGLIKNIQEKLCLLKLLRLSQDFNFFSISSSSVTSKFLGEGEKLMKVWNSILRILLLH